MENNGLECFPFPNNLFIGCFSENTFPFLTLSWPSNIFDSPPAGGSPNRELSCRDHPSRSTVTGTLIKNVTDGTRRKKMKGIFEKLPGQTSFHQQMFVATGNSKARIFQSSLET
jgi:hypothetical protein